LIIINYNKTLIYLEIVDADKNKEDIYHHQTLQIVYSSQYDNDYKNHSESFVVNFLKLLQVVPGLDNNLLMLLYEILKKEWLFVMGLTQRLESQDQKRNYALE